MRTLLIESKEDKWSPIFVDSIRNSFKIKMKYSISKNIAYNIQYLEYLDKQLNELRLTSVLTKMIYKNYIITSMSIIEAIFYCLLEERNLIPKEYWETEKTYISSEIGLEDNRTRIVSELQKKVLEKERKMNLESLSSKIKSKKILSHSKINFPVLEYYRKLRNKVHIYISDGCDESDYNSFNFLDYLMIRAVLYAILSDDAVTKKEQREIYDNMFYNAYEKFLNEYNDYKKQNKGSDNNEINKSG